MGRRINYGAGIFCVLFGVYALSSTRYYEVQSGTLNPLADSIIWYMASMLILAGISYALRAAYSRAWREWTWTKRLRAVVLGAALFLFCLSAADIAVVWTAGTSVNQVLYGTNTTLIEGVDFREWVTELGGGALLAVLGLLLDLAE